MCMCVYGEWVSAMASAMVGGNWFMVGYLGWILWCACNGLLVVSAVVNVWMGWRVCMERVDGGVAC